MSVPQTFTGEHADCGGAITFHPAAERERLLRGEEVSLSAFCDRCSRPVSIRYALGASEAAPPPDRGDVELANVRPVDPGALAEPASFPPPVATPLYVSDEAPRHVSESVLVLAGAGTPGHGPVAAARDSFSRLNDRYRPPSFATGIDGAAEAPFGGLGQSHDRSRGRSAGGLLQSSTDLEPGTGTESTSQPRRLDFELDPSTDEVAAEIAKRFEAARQRMEREAAVQTGPPPPTGAPVSLAPPTGTPIPAVPPATAPSPATAPPAPAQPPQVPTVTETAQAVAPPAAPPTPEPAVAPQVPAAPVAPAENPLGDAQARGFDWGEEDLAEDDVQADPRDRRKRLLQMLILIAVFSGIGYTAYAITSDLQGRSSLDAPATEGSGTFRDASELDGVETPAGEDPPAVTPSSDDAGANEPRVEGEAADLQPDAGNGGSE